MANPTMNNTKKEMLAAYAKLKAELAQKEKENLKPEAKVAKKKAKEVIKVASELTSQKVIKNISNLKSDISQVLVGLSDKLEDASDEYSKLEEAIKLKEVEIKEIYDIEKEALTLVTLIQAQKAKKEEFTAEIEEKKEVFELDMKEKKKQWNDEQKEYLKDLKEKQLEEKKKRTREQEEYEYKIKREAELTKDKLKDQEELFAKQLVKKEEEFDAKLEEQNKLLKERKEEMTKQEDEIKEMKAKVEAFPTQLSEKIAEAVKKNEKMLSSQYYSKEALLKKTMEGDKNLFEMKIETLEKTIAQQNTRIEMLSTQLETAYQKVEQIALKTVEGNANSQTLMQMEKMMESKRDSKNK